MLDPVLLPFLRCPETRQTLTLHRLEEIASLAAPVASGAAVSRGGKIVTPAPETLLLREDGRVAYPVRGGIPLLLVEEGIETLG